MCSGRAVVCRSASRSKVSEGQPLTSCWGAPSTTYSPARDGSIFWIIPSVCLLADLADRVDRYDDFGDFEAYDFISCNDL